MPKTEPGEEILSTIYIPYETKKISKYENPGLMIFGIQLLAFEHRE